MTEERNVNETTVHTAEGAPRWIGMAVVVLAAISLIALGFGWSASNRASAAEQTLTTDQQTIQSLQQEVGLLGKRLTQTEESNAQARGELNVVTDRLKLTQGELGRARAQAKQIREDYSKQLAEMDAAVKSELATKASAEDVRTLSGDVGGVRNDLNATRENLQMARGELGTLIARNHEEVEHLRRLGERDYFEFNIEKKGSKQRVGDVVLELRGVNTKRNQFTVALYADDLRLEKKNRSVNEPIYFYTRGYRAPLELVVNKLAKNKITGYVSVPKGAATASASGN